ncbi:MAG: hypothetical protein JO006_20700 [Paucibacter sp.]|nr:hypothetical protein [Roseateles sp.]
MPLHQSVQSLLLVGVQLHHAPAPAPAAPPAGLQPLIEALKPEHDQCNERAIEFGHRYRSAFWALYLLSALAVLFAVLPEGLGWAGEHHPLHRYAPLWGVAELAVIAAVVATYLRGHKRDWQGQWLSARMQAELMGYLPLAATLQTSQAEGFALRWYASLADGAEPSAEMQRLQTLCQQHAAEALLALEGMQRDVAPWARWMRAVVAGQQHYHERVAHRYHALQHRVHQINAALFVLTALGTAAHLFWHQSWLLLMATVLPALGAALHGALAQSEAYRLEMNSRRLGAELLALHAAIGAVDLSASETARPRLRALGQKALDLILAEHHDWHQLVRPHRLPLG